ncbi:MAG: hypothetical protein QNJ88_07930 [Acidimicrobiia bacterium]|nr:hypothetical protein [Acidimicrobiia bacterium]
MSALGIAALIALPFVFEQVDAFGNAADVDQFPAKVEAVDRPAFAGESTDNDKPLAAAPADTKAAKETSSATPTEAAAPQNEFSYAATTSDWGVDPKTLLKDASASVVLEGQLARRQSDPAPRWSTAKIVPDKSGRHEFTLDWAGDGNLKIALYEAKTRKQVAANKKKDHPKEISAKLAKGTDYRLVVWASSGKGSFVVIESSAPTLAEEKAPTTTKAPKATTTTTKPPKTTTTTTTTTQAPKKQPPASRPGGMLVGVFADDPAKSEQEAGGAWDGIRWYVPGDFGTTLPNKVVSWLNRGTVVHLSYKSAVPMNDNDRSRLATLLSNVPDGGGELWLTFWHEPENDSFSAANWGKVQRNLVAAVNKANKSRSVDIVPVFTLMGWGLGGNTSNIEYLNAIDDISRSDGIVMIDPYDWPSTKGQGTVDLFDDYTKDVVKSLKNRGWAWGIAETGTALTGNQRTQWILRNVQDAYNNGAVAFWYFNKDKPNEADNRYWKSEPAGLAALRSWTPN